MHQAVDEGLALMLALCAGEISGASEKLGLKSHVELVNPCEVGLQSLLGLPGSFGLIKLVVYFPHVDQAIVEGKHLLEPKVWLSLFFKILSDLRSGVAFVERALGKHSNTVCVIHNEIVVNLYPFLLVCPFIWQPLYIGLVRHLEISEGVLQAVCKVLPEQACEAGHIIQFAQELY